MSADLLEVDVARRASVALDLVHRANTEWKRTNHRQSALTAREALAALQSEALYVAVCAAALRHGEVLSDDDFQLLTEAVRLCNLIGDEVLS